MSGRCGCAENKDSSATHTFIYNGKESSSNVYAATNATDHDALLVTVKSSNGAKLELEPVYFLWLNPDVPQGPQYENGQKGAIIEMFGC